MHFGKHLVARFRHVVLRTYAVYLLRRLVYLRNAVVVYFVILVELCRYRIFFGHKAVYFGFESRALLGGKGELFAYSRNSFGKVLALSLQRLALSHESRHVGTYFGQLVHGFHHRAVVRLAFALRESVNNGQILAVEFLRFALCRRKFRR